LYNPFQYISRRLGAQLLIVAVAALSCAFISHHLVANVAANWFFYDPRFDSYWRARSISALECFQDYVTEENLSMRQALSDIEWNRTHPEIILFTEPAVPYEENQDDDEGNNDVHHEEILCSDGIIYATSYSPGSIYFARWKAGGVIAGSVCFLAILFPYTVHMIRRIKNLYQQVLHSSHNGRSQPVCLRGNDELSELGKEIEYMRVSLLGLLEREAHMREDNEQLVASLSHDIRSPLTKLIGYLDILVYEKYTTPDEDRACLEKAAEKAKQLKALTDELFNRFVSNGRVAHESRVLVDGGELLNQVLYEQCSELEADGFLIDPLPAISRGYFLHVRVEDIRRTFDNIFSNLRKYANERIPIQIEVSETRTTISVRISNHTRPAPEHVQSHKIGLPTVRTLMEQNGGTVDIRNRGAAFSVCLSLPKIEQPSQKEPNR